MDDEFLDRLAAALRERECSTPWADVRVDRKKVWRCRAQELLDTFTAAGLAVVPARLLTEAAELLQKASLHEWARGPDYWSRHNTALEELISSGVPETATARQGQPEGEG